MHVEMDMECVDCNLWISSPWNIYIGKIVLIDLCWSHRAKNSLVLFDYMNSIYYSSAFLIYASATHLYWNMFKELVEGKAFLSKPI